MVYRTAAVTTELLIVWWGGRCSVTGGLPTSYFYTHTHTHTHLATHTHTHTWPHTHTHPHTHLATHIGTSVFKSRANAAFPPIQRLLCDLSVISVMVKVAFGDFFSSTLVFCC